MRHDRTGTKTLQLVDKVDLAVYPFTLQSWGYRLPSRTDPLLALAFRLFQIQPKQTTHPEFSLAGDSQKKPEGMRFCIAPIPVSHSMLNRNDVLRILNVRGQVTIQCLLKINGENL